MLSETKKYKEAYEAYTNGKTFADAGAASDPTKMTEAEVIAADEALGGSTKNIIRIANDDRALLYAGVGGGFFVPPCRDLSDTCGSQVSP